MPKKSFTAIGHIVNDIEPHAHLGGGVSYASIAAAKLGYKASIITRCPPDHPYIDQLKHLGVTVHVLPVKNNTITSFSNIYDTDGHRTQRVTKQQDPITLADLKDIEKFLEQDSIILAAPVIGEVDMKLFPHLARYASLAVTAQGYFRHIEQDGRVRHRPWAGFEKYLKFCQMTIFSQEDISINGEPDNTLLEKIKNACETVVLTQGEKGATVYQQGQNSLHTDAVSLKDSKIVDFTGAGDVFAAAFIAEYAKSGDVKSAAKFAHRYAALKLMGKDGIGIGSIPNLEEEVPPLIRGG